MKKSVFSLIFTVCICFIASAYSTVVFGQESGSCGEAALWSLDDNGTLTISGTGQMDSYASDGAVPWCSVSSQIKEVIIENGITNVADYSFYHCDNLEKVNLGDSVESIGTDAFNTCTSLKEINFSENITEIEERAFAECTSLTSVVLPDTVEKLGNYVFSGCEEITEIYLGKKVERIGSNAFYACEKLTRITLPESLTTIGQYAFEYCKNLSEIDIPDFVTTIEQFAFAYCRGLSKINIGKSLETVGNYAFRETVISEITLPDSIKQISMGAFTDCKKLKTVTIGKGLTGMRQNAFKNCVALENIYWNAVSAPMYTSSFDVFNKAGVEGNGIKVVFGDSVEVIPSYLFYPSASNYRCNLKEVTIGKNVKTIGNYAFGDSNYLEKIYWNAINVNDMASSNLYPTYTFSNAGISTNGIELVFGNEVERVPAFGLCAYGTSTFKAPKITKVVLSDSIVEIDDYGFGNCCYIEDIVWGKNIVSIGNSAFFNCNALKELNLPETVQTIGEWAFGSCYALKEITLPDSVSVIGEYSFRNCTGLIDLVLSEKLAYVSGCAFEMCNNLTTVTIKKGTTRIGDSAFYACDSIETVNYCGGESDWNKVSISGYNNPLLNAKFVYDYILPSGGSISFDLLSNKINIDSAKSYNDVLMIAVMYKDGAVYKVAPYVVQIKKGTNSFDCPFDSFDGADEIKFMAWDGFSNMKPIFDKYEEPIV